MSEFFLLTLKSKKYNTVENIYLKGELPKYTNFENFFNEHLYKVFTDTLEKLKNGKLIKAKSLYMLYIETVEHLINEKGFVLVNPQSIYFDYTGTSGVSSEDFSVLKKTCVKFCKSGYSGIDKQIAEYSL